MASEVRIENKAAHVKYIALTGGDAITVPPTPTDVPGGGTVVKFADDDERKRFDAALKTQAVQAWIEAGELVIHGSSGTPTSALSPTSGTPQSETTQPNTTPTQADADRQATTDTPVEQTAPSEQSTSSSGHSRRSRDR